VTTDVCEDQNREVGLWGGVEKVALINNNTFKKTYAKREDRHSLV